ncbi:hypothetical protein ABTW96_04000 [Nocardia beijingensis]
MSAASPSAAAKGCGAMSAVLQAAVSVVPIVALCLLSIWQLLV